MDIGQEEQGRDGKAQQGEHCRPIASVMALLTVNEVETSPAQSSIMAWMGQRDFLLYCCDWDGAVLV